MTVQPSVSHGRQATRSDVISGRKDVDNIASHISRIEIAVLASLAETVNARLFVKKDDIGKEMLFAKNSLIRNETPERWAAICQQHTLKSVDLLSQRGRTTKVMDCAHPEELSYSILSCITLSSIPHEPFVRVTVTG